MTPADAVRDMAIALAARLAELGHADEVETAIRCLIEPAYAEATCPDDMLALVELIGDIRAVAAMRP